MSSVALGWWDRPRPRRLVVAGLLLLTGVLALTSLVGDSVTFDETSHLTAGLSYLKTGDFRLAPDHPPLPKIWCAWPLLLMELQWPADDNPAWRDAQVFTFGRRFLFEMNNDGQRLVVVGRCMMAVLLLATGLTTYLLGRMTFGPGAGMLALALAALSPTLLAHGRLVTTDLPITLATALTLVTFSRLLHRLTWWWLLATATALGAAAVTKFSWPLVVPALLTMAIIGVAWPPRDDQGAPPRETRSSRAARVGVSVVLLAAAVWLSIWAAYGFRPALLAPPPSAGATPEGQAAYERLKQKLAETWTERMYRPEDGTPRPGLIRAALRLAATTGILPEAYVYGLAETLATTSERTAYFRGQYSNTGWRTYFPTAFAIKTPLPTLVLLVAGIAAVVSRRVRPVAPVLLVGLVVFVVVYAAYVINGRLNIGHRHLLPIYPALFVLAGAAVAWLRTHVGRVIVAAMLVWLAVVNTRIHPHYLAYFNELVGGPAHGHLYLADSNIDWGQDLLRLADYARRHPSEPIKLAYFGSAVPTRYLPCTALPSVIQFDPRADLTAGTYVVSVMQLLGVYTPEARPEFWDEQSLAAYRALWDMATEPPGPDDLPAIQRRRAQARMEYESLRSVRLLSQLRYRRPDERIGYSLFLFRLTDYDIEQLAGPKLPCDHQGPSRAAAVPSPADVYDRSRSSNQSNADIGSGSSPSSR